MFSKSARTLSAVAPWLIIASLLYVALFVEPKPVGSTVTPSAIESRDRYYGVASPASETLWLVGADGKIVRTDDAGESWHVQASDVVVHFQDIAAWDQQRAVVVGNRGTVLFTDDGGERWQSAEAPKNDVANKLIDVKAYADGEAWAVGEFGTILRSSDYGRTWSRMRELEDFILNEVVRIDEQTLLVVGEFGTVLRTSDNGNEWSLVDVPLETSLMAVDFRNSQHGLAGGLEGALLATNDAGQTWFAIEPDMQFPTGTTRPGKTQAFVWADLTSEHIFSLRWVPHLDSWVATGDKGIWVTGSANLTHWQSGRLAEREMGWHTAMVPFAGGILMTGMNVGLWDLSSWQLLGEG